MLRKPGIRKTYWDTKKLNFKLEYGDFSVEKVCSSYDDELELWSGLGVQSYINGLPGGSRPPGHPSGEDDTAYYSLNFIVKLPAADSLNLVDSGIAYTGISNPLFNSTKPTNIYEIAIAVLAVSGILFDDYKENFSHCNFEMMLVCRKLD